MVFPSSSSISNWRSTTSRRNNCTRNFQMSYWDHTCEKRHSAHQPLNFKSVLTTPTDNWRRRETYPRVGKRHTGNIIWRGITCWRPYQFSVNLTQILNFVNSFRSLRKMPLNIWLSVPHGLRTWSYYSFGWSWSHNKSLEPKKLLVGSSPLFTFLRTTNKITECFTLIIRFFVSGTQREHFGSRKRPPYNPTSSHDDR